MNKSKHYAQIKSDIHGPSHLMMQMDKNRLQGKVGAKKAESIPFLIAPIHDLQFNFCLWNGGQWKTKVEQQCSLNGDISHDDRINYSEWMKITPHFQLHCVLCIVVVAFNKWFCFVLYCFVWFCDVFVLVFHTCFGAKTM